ncbi:MAG: ornithine carbamoyltransferase [Actinobacteria bacterium]|nr:ornithine carbamoyltransferase [Actinomycetota bacterium]
MSPAIRHLIEIDDLSPDEVLRVLDLSASPDRPGLLAGRTVGLVFEKPSMRTRNAMEVAVAQLGGYPVTMQGQEVGLGSREPATDVATVLSRYHALIGARVNDDITVRAMATVSRVPVINLLSDRSHPCQALADLLTLRNLWGSFRGRSLTWVGDGNNVCRSLALGAAAVGIDVRLASPGGYGLDPADLASIRRFGTSVETFDDPTAAVRGTDAVCTDVWSSMGHEAEAGVRRGAFSGWTIDARLMSLAAPDAAFLHCLPAHRGEEVSSAVIDGPQSAVWDQAENRLHTARGLLMFLLDKDRRVITKATWDGLPRRRPT